MGPDPYEMNWRKDLDPDNDECLNVDDEGNEPEIDVDNRE
jgi:hypothetical protein